MDRPYYKDFDSYIKEIDSLKVKYNKKIKILSGIEINLNFKHDNDESRIPYERLKNLDYVLLERINGLAPFEPPGKHHIKLHNIGTLASKINTKIGLAHTDIFKLAEIYSEGKGIEHGIDFVLGIMKQYNIFWELNTQPQYKYFDYILNNWNSEKVIMLFNKIRENKIEVIPGSDNHYIDFDFDAGRLKEANMIGIIESDIKILG
jgi:histidinol phosphatase-like PHP family hydrolase